jgi:ABC-type Na+ transport system ATPase subunit NatA
VRTVVAFHAPERKLDASTAINQGDDTRYSLTAAGSIRNREIVQDPRASVIVSSHQLGDVERIADELLVLHQGRALQAGPTDAIVGEHRTLEEALLAWTAA